MRKRAAASAGEIGLFIETEVFEEDFGHVKMGAEVQVKATTPRSLRQLKFAWTLAGKIADGCDWVESKEDCMDFMLIEAKHFRRIYDPLRKVAILKPKPTNFGAMDGTDYTRLLKRIVHVATTIMIPGMNDADLIAEVEAMVGPDLATHEPVPAKPPRASRARKSNPGPVSQREGGEQTARPDADTQTSAPAGRPAPSNEAEYLTACRSWLQKQTNRFAAFDHFNGETHRKMRLDLKISTGARKMLEREIGEFFDAKDRTNKGAAQAEG